MTLHYTKTLFLACSIIGLASCLAQVDKKSISEKDTELLVKADSILQLMSLKEKLGQISQHAGGKEANEALIEKVRNGEVSSILNGLESFYTVEERNRVQKIAVEESRLGIPIIFGHDVIHGFKTIFPLSLAQSCSWSPELIEQAAIVAAKESSAQGVDWTFAPMLDVSRDPRWGRIVECYGEDPFLNATFGAAAIRGFQGNDVSAPDKVVSCLKHFVGYGAATGGRDYQYTDISERSLHEVYLNPFKAGVDAGALTAMSAFNDVNGVPASANAKYIRNTLKEKWNFPGYVVSDWNAIKELMPHGIAKDTLHAAILGMKAGVDMEMTVGSFSLLDKAIKDGSIAENLIDEAVRRILFVKLKKGLFDNPYTDERRIKTDILTPEHRALARKAARESMVLLKNETNVLPLKDKLTVSVVGPFAKEQNLMGWWKSLGNKKDVISPIQGLISNNGKKLTLLDEITTETDVIVVCLGESHRLFGEFNSRSNIRLPEGQEEFLSDLKKHGKKIVTVIFNGRPLVLEEVIKISDAVLLAWHPGTEAGNALADVLYGAYNPSGKLTTSFPKSIGQVPVYYNQRNSGRPHQNIYKGADQSPYPLFPFGYGLSYTTFEYDKLKLSSNQISEGESITVSAEITNSGNASGEEVVQLYIRDLVGSTTRPIKELIDFRKIDLNIGETKKVEFRIRTEQLKVLDNNFEPRLEAGDFYVWVAPNSKEGLQGSFEVK